MLALAIRYLLDRAVATRFDDRERAEWPPHPARVFSMLVAVLHDGGGYPAERTALEWLQRQPPPQIAASASSERTAVIQFVPVNDAALPRMPKGGVGALSLPLVEAGASVLPERRMRQARRFPTTVPEHPTVVLIWPDADPDPSLRSALVTLAARCSRLGHSSSLVHAWVQDDPPPATLVPGQSGGVVLRVPGPDQVAALESAYSQAEATGRRGRLPCRFVGYGEPSIPSAGVAGWAGNLVVWRLRREEAEAPSALELPATAMLCGALRDAVMAVGPQPPPEVVSGHAADGAPSIKPHLGFCPLPFVDRRLRHADGHLLGVAAVLPRQLDAAGLETLLDGLSRLQRLTLGRSGAWTLESSWTGDVPTALAPGTWIRASQVWASVTPVVLDRYPDEPYGAEAEAIVAKACTLAGYPEPIAVVLSPKSLLHGVPPTKAFPGLVRRDGRSRVHVHALVTFSSPIQGPLLIGAGRYRGLGFFRPMDNS